MLVKVNKNLGHIQADLDLQRKSFYQNCSCLKHSRSKFLCYCNQIKTIFCKNKIFFFLLRFDLLLDLHHKKIIRKTNKNY